MLVTVLLTWAQVADALVLYEGAIPLAVACLLRVNRRRGPLAGNWYDLSLAAGAAVSAAAARLILRLIQHAGGFTVRPAAVSFLPANSLATRLYGDVAQVLDVFGGKFFGTPTGAAMLVLVPGLVGFLLAAWAVATGVRRLYRADTDLIVQVLTIAALIVLAAFLLGTKHDTNEIVGLLPLGAVLAGRLLARPIIRDRLVPALALVLACCAGIVAYNASQPADPARGYELTASWLEAHHLHYGLAGFWDATVVTMDSGDRIQVRPVRSFQARIVTTLSESSASWYDPHQHYANFVITRRRLGLLRRLRRGARPDDELRAAGRDLPRRPVRRPGVEQEPARPAAHAGLVQRGLAVEHPGPALPGRRPPGLRCGACPADGQRKPRSERRAAGLAAEHLTQF